MDLAVDEVAWGMSVAILRHQATYLRLVSSKREPQGGRCTPQEQLAINPADYRDFLRGVSESHRIHAKLVADHPALSTASHLADLGGGLGAFSTAWITSRPDRSATLIDLPALENVIRDDMLPSPRISFYGIDLTKLDDLPRADVYLLSNVLHLLPEWRQVLRHVARCAPSGASIAIFEAERGGASGALFDLQVHLRSGCVGGLLDPAAIHEQLLTLGFQSIRSLPILDTMDPYERQYSLLIASQP